MTGSPYNVTPARLIYDTLVRVDQDGNPHPGLATAWKFPDDRTIELTLRKGVKFQDRTPFNASAVKFSVERTRDSGNANLDKNLAQLDSVEVVDEGTVRFHLKTPILAAFFGQATQSPSAGASVAFRPGNRCRRSSRLVVKKTTTPAPGFAPSFCDSGVPE